MIEVISTILLLLLVIASVLSFNLWFNSFSISKFTDINVKTNNYNNLNLLGIKNNIIYIFSNNNISITKLEIISNLGNVLCSYNANVSYNFSKDLFYSFSLDYFYNNISNNYTSSENHDLDAIFYRKPLIKKGIFSNSFYFDGSNYLIIPYNNKLDLINNYSISLWFKSQTTDNSLFNYSRIFSRGINEAYDIYISNIDNRSRIAIYNSTNSIYADLKNGFNSNDNKWHFIVATFGEGYLRYYSDLLLQEEINVSYNTSVSTTNLTIANKLSTVNNRFIGYIDEIKVFNKSLSLNEINNLNYFNTPKISILKGVNKIDIGGCFLKDNEVYNLLLLTNLGDIIDYKFVNH